MKDIDLRSDTVTQPTQAMREAIFNARLGDNGYGEDPTVNALEEMAAAVCGKEAALLVTSGTQGNQIATLCWVGKGDEVICEANAHIYNSETGAIAALAGAQVRAISGRRGVISADDVEAAIRNEKMNVAKTGLISIENTHNFAGGTCYSVFQTAEIRRVAERYGIPLHIDGARIFNAAVAQKTSVAELVKDADSVQFCLSKGLAAPVGSLLVGSHQFIAKAKRYRRMLGGGMRQAGIIAAAGIVALETMVERLEEDHRHAKLLTEKLAALGFGIDLDTVQTNIVIFDAANFNVSTAELVAQLSNRGIKVFAINAKQIRMVTHYGIDKADIDATCAALEQIVKAIE